MNDKKNRNPSVAVKSCRDEEAGKFLCRAPPQKIEMAPARLHQLTRRERFFCLALAAGGAGGCRISAATKHAESFGYP